MPVKRINIILKLLLVVLIVFIFSNHNSTAQNWEWAKVNKIDSEVSYGKYVRADTAGNIYLAGSYFDNIQIDTIIHSSNNNENGFIAKFDRNGNCIWLKSIQSSSRAFVRDFEVDKSGNCYVLGEYYDNIIIEYPILTEYAYGNRTYFINIDSNGDLLWEHVVSDNNNIQLKLDSNKYPILYIESEYYFLLDNEIVFGTDPNSWNYIARFNPNGEYLDYLRIKRSDIVYHTFYESFHISNTNKYIVGYKSFGSVIPSYIGLYDSTAQQWYLSFYNEFYITSIDSDSDENIYITGYFYNEIEIGELIFYATNKSGLILKYNNLGDLIWHKQVTGNADADVICMRVSNDSLVYFCGSFSNTLQIDSILYTRNVSSMYITKMNREGDIKWTQFTESEDYAEPKSLCVNAENEVIVTGSFRENMQLGKFIFEADNTSFFIAKINNLPHTPITMYGDSTICKGINEFYVLDTVKGVSYKWYLQGVGIVESNSRKLTYYFTDTGEYKLSVIPYNNLMEGDTLTKVIHVKEVPAKPVIIGDSSACIGTEAYNTDINPEYTYSWDLDTGGSLFVIENTAIVDWSSIGNYQLRLSTSNYCGSSEEDTLQIIVHDLPAQPSEINGNNEVCVGIYNYSVSNVSGLTYNWTISGGGTIYANKNQVTVHWTSAGNNVLSVTVGNSCGNGIARTLSVKVNALPEQPSVIFGDKQVCPEIVEIYTIIEKENEEYTWSISGGGIMDASEGRADIEWITPGTYTISVTPENECGTGQPREEIIEVFSIPEKSDTIYGLTDVCQGTQSYFVDLETNVNYIWSLSGGGILSPSKHTAEVEWTDSGTYSITVTPYNMCGTGNSRTIKVHVKGIEDQITEIEGNDDACAGDEIYQVTEIIGMTYTWELLSGGTFTPEDTNAITITWDTTGEHFLKLFTSDGCSQSKIIKVELIPDQPSEIYGDTLVCMAEQLYSVTKADNINYTWQITGGGNISSQYYTSSIEWTDTGNFTLSVTPSNKCGDGMARSLDIKVSDIPMIPEGFLGDTVTCIGTSGYSVANSLGVNYTWKINGIKLAEITSNSVNINFIDTGTYIFSINKNNQCGEGPILNKIIEVIDIPEQPLLFGDKSVCFGNEIYNVKLKKHETYNWSLDNGGTITTMNDTAYINWDMTGTFLLSVTPSNKCGIGNAKSKVIDVYSIPEPISQITGDTLNCLGSKIYSTTAMPTVEYNWELNGGGVLMPYSNAAQIVWTTPGDYILSLTPYNECGIGDTLKVKITVRDIPEQPSIINGEIMSCVNDTRNYFIDKVDELTYTWTISSNDEMQTNENIAHITWLTSGQKTLTVKPSNYCGIGPLREVIISVGELPDAPIITYGDTNSCLDKSQYRVNANSSVNYNWSLSGGGILSYNENNATVDWLSDGEYILSTYASNNCGNSISTDLNIQVQDVPGKVDKIIGDTIACVGKYVYTMVDIDSSLNYLWTVSSGGELNSTNYPVSVNWIVPGIHNIAVIPYNSCGYGSSTNLIVSIKDIPSQPNIIVGESSCCTGAIESYTFSEINESDYRWTLTGGGDMNADENNATINWEEAGDHTLTVTPFNICGTGIPRKLVVTIEDDLPQINGTIEGDSVVCVNKQAVFSVPDVSGVSYYWNIEGNNNYTNILNLVYIKWFEKGDYLVSVYPQNSCGQGDAVEMQVQVEEVLPEVQIYYLGDSLIAISEGEMQWYYNENLLTFETDSFIIPLDEGEYYAIAKNTCNEVSSEVMYYSDLINLEWDIPAYPNPISGYFTIILPVNYSLESIELIDKNGRVIKTFKNFTNDKIRLDFTDIVPGNYYLRLNSDSKPVLKKIVVL
ncbi:T9SS type A sorting domain-containing protein [Bacteroidota bacterium]